MPILAINKRAGYDYELLEFYEAGLKLTGQEVKSAKNGHINLKGAYVTISNNQASLLNAHIAKYDKASIVKDYDPYRSRVLLLNKREIKYLTGKKEEQGITLIPTKVYTQKGLIKLEFALGKGKKKFDKRKTIKEREVKRNLRREYGV